MERKGASHAPCVVNAGDGLPVVWHWKGVKQREGEIIENYRGFKNHAVRTCMAINIKTERMSAYTHLHASIHLQWMDTQNWNIRVCASGL